MLGASLGALFTLVMLLRRRRIRFRGRRVERHAMWRNAPWLAFAVLRAIVGILLYVERRAETRATP
jgi:hypothetical protein